MSDPITALLPTTPAEPPLGEYDYRDTSTEFGAGGQLKATFPNGYGASVIRNRYSYGGEEGFFELAVVHGDRWEDAPLCYATPITEDVLGWLTETKVIEELHKIARLERNDTCSHDHRED
jgi:hypothetical protein